MYCVFIYQRYIFTFMYRYCDVDTRNEFELFYEVVLTSTQFES